MPEMDLSWPSPDLARASADILADLEAGFRAAKGQ